MNIQVTKPFAAEPETGLYAASLPRTEAATEKELRVMLADLMGVCSSAASLLETRAPHIAQSLSDRAARADALLQRHRP